MSVIFLHWGFNLIQIISTVAFLYFVLHSLFNIKATMDHRWTIFWFGYIDRNDEPVRKRLKSNHADQHSFTLKHGSLLVMRGYTQRDWLHSVPKRAKAEATRINLTFRHVLWLTPRQRWVLEHSFEWKICYCHSGERTFVFLG